MDGARRKLVLVTNGYPFGKSEKTFIGPELTFLAESFDVTVVAQASPDMLVDEASRSGLPDGVRLVVHRPQGKGTRRLRGLSLPFCQTGRAELRDLLADGVSLWRLRSSAGSYSEARALCHTMKRAGLFEDSADAIYYSFWYSTGCLALALAKQRQPDMHVVARAHGYDLYQVRSRDGRLPFQRVKADACDRILFVSRQGMRYFEEAYGRERHPGQYVLNYLGVPDSGRENPKRDPNEPRRILSCSSVIPVKRVGLIAEAVALLGDDVEWVHFGDGMLLDEVKKRACRLGLRTTFMGHVSNGVVLSYYAAHYVDAFVNVSSSEGLPVSLMEAASFGIPLVATCVGGSPEAFDGNGVLLSADPTPAQVAGALSEILNASEEKCDSMRASSVRIFEERFDLVRNKLALLRELEGL